MESYGINWIYFIKEQATLFIEQYVFDFLNENINYLNKNDFEAVSCF